MILDLSSYNGIIDWDKLTTENDIERVILRSTTKNGKLDTMFINNANAAKAHDVPIDIYKFSYATDCQTAYKECLEVASAVNKAGITYDNLWIDIENDGATRWTKERAFNVIAGYHSCYYGYEGDWFTNMSGFIGIYCNFDYYLRVLSDVHKSREPLWIARWTNGKLGIEGARNIKYWQYTSTGRVSGINGNVDISRKVN